MLRKIESFLPASLKRLDKHLLLNHPLVWASKIHYVAFFTAVCAALIMLRTFVLPVHLGDLPNVELGFGLMFIPLAIAFVFYVWRLSLFNVEKQFGERGRGFSLKQQGLHALSILMMASLPFLYGYSLNAKIDQSVNDAQFVADVNALNIGHFAQNQSNGDYQGYLKFAPYYFERGDLLSLEEVRRVWENNKLQQTQASYHSLLNKYSGGFSNSTLSAYTYNIERRVDRTINQIAKAKSHHRYSIFYNNDFLKFFALFLGSLWLLLSMFSKSRPLTFLYAVIAGFVGAGFLGAGSALAHEYMHIDFESSFSFLYTALFIGLIFFAYRRYGSRRSLIWKNVSLILVVVMAVFLPLVFMTATDSYVSSSAAFGAVFLGLSATAVLWNLVFEKRFIKMMARPIND